MIYCVFINCDKVEKDTLRKFYTSLHRFQNVCQTYIPIKIFLQIVNKEAQMRAFIALITSHNAGKNT